MSGTARRIGLCTNVAFVLVERRGLLHVHAEDVLFDVARQSLELVNGMRMSRDAEDCITEKEKGQSMVIRRRCRRTLIQLF